MLKNGFATSRPCLTGMHELHCCHESTGGGNRMRQRDQGLRECAGVCRSLPAITVLEPVHILRGLSLPYRWYGYNRLA